MTQGWQLFGTRKNQDCQPLYGGMLPLLQTAPAACINSEDLPTQLQMRVHQNIKTMAAAAWAVAAGCWVLSAVNAVFHALMSDQLLQSSPAALICHLAAISRSRNAAALYHTMTALEEALAHKQGETNALQKQVAALTASMEAAQKDIAEKTAALAATQAAVMQQEEAIARHQAAMVDLEHELASREATIKALEEDIKSRKEVERALTAQVEVRAADLRTLQAELTSTDDQAHGQANIVAELQGKLTSQEQENARLNALVEQLQRQMTTLQAENNHLASRNKELASEVEDLTREVACARAGHAQLQDQAVSTAAKHEAELVEMTHKAATLQDLVESKEKLVQENKVHQQMIASLTADITQEKACAAVLSQGKAAAEDSLAAKERELEANLAKLAEAERQLKQALAKDMQSQDRIALMTRLYNDVKARVEQLTTDKQVMDTALSTMTKQLSDTTAIKTEAEQQLARVRAEIAEKLEVAMKQAEAKAQEKVEEDFRVHALKLAEATGEGKRKAKQLQSHIDQVEKQKAELAEDLKAAKKRSAQLDADVGYFKLHTRELNTKVHRLEATITELNQQKASIDRSSHRVPRKHDSDVFARHDDDYGYVKAPAHGNTSPKSNDSGYDNNGKDPRRSAIRNNRKWSQNHN